MTEYLRTWKLFSLLAGISLLIIGSYYFAAPDWDIPISFIMALLTYLTAPTSLRICLEHRWKKFPIMIFFTWLSVDGCYSFYWSIMNPQALAEMRSANFWASLSLYLTCGLIWYPRMDLKDIIYNLLKK